MSIVSLPQLLKEFHQHNRRKLKEYKEILEEEKRIIESWFDVFCESSEAEFHNTKQTDKSRIEFKSNWTLYDENVELLNTCKQFIREL